MSNKDNASLKTRLKSIEMATGRKHADVRTLWEKIKNIPINVASIESGNEDSRSREANAAFAYTLSLNEVSYDFEFTSFNIIHYDHENTVHALLEYLLTDLKEDVNFIMNEKSVDVLAQSQKDFLDRIRIKSINPEEEFKKTFYFIEEDVEDHGGTHKARDWMTKRLDHVKEYSHVGIHLFFVSQDRHPLPCFPENTLGMVCNEVNNGNATVVTMGAEVVTIDRYIEHKQIYCHIHPPLKDPIPTKAPYSMLKKTVQRNEIGVGLGLYGDQVNWGDPFVSPDENMILNGIIVGGVGSGRSIVLRTLISQLLDRDYEISLCDLEGTKVFDTKYENFTFRKEGCLEELKKINDLIYKRYEMFQQNKKAFNSIDDHFSRTIIFIDDLGSLKEMLDSDNDQNKSMAEEMLSLIDNILQKGSMVGIHVILSTSKYRKGMFPFPSSALFVKVFLQKSNSELINADDLFGFKSSLKSNTRGRGRMSTLGSSPIQYQTFFKRPES